MRESVKSSLVNKIDIRNIYSFFLNILDECDGTLTRKLQRLQDAGLVDTEIGKMGRKSVINYRLTAKGGAVFSRIDGLVHQ